MTVQKNTPEILNRMALKQHFLRTVVWMYFLIAIMAAGVVQAQQNKEKSKLENNKKELEEEITLTTKLLNETKKTRQKSVNQVVILNNQIKKREQLIGAISGQVDEIHGQISTNQSSVEKLKGELKKLREEYAAMVYMAFKNSSQVNRLMFIFASGDVNQAYLRIKYLQQFTAYRKIQIKRITSTENHINSKIKELESDKVEKLDLLKSKESEKNKLTVAKKEKSQTIAQLQQKEKELRKKLKEKESALQKLQRAIEKIIADQVKQSAETAKKTGAKPAAPNVMTLTPEEQQLSNSFTSNKGRLPWPAEKGVLTSTYGEHDHPVLKGIKTRNNGINIVTSAGGTARAVFSGTVTGIMSIPNLNNVVIVRHGDFLSVYSNLDQVYVKKGDKVKTKQNLGRIYTDTEESKTELHFEIWNGKKLQDPMSWLAK